MGLKLKIVSAFYHFDNIGVIIGFLFCLYIARYGLLEQRVYLYLSYGN